MRRDRFGIIIQTDENNPDYEDGGDSAFSTGLMAFSGSKIDMAMMPFFITHDRRIMRHPFQSSNTGTHPHNDPRSVSRDQVIAFFAGCFIDTTTHKFITEACLKYAQGWRVNRDILGPSHKYYLYKLAGVKPSTALTFFAYIHQGCSILWDCYIKPHSEKNQSIVMNTVFGKRWIKFLRNNHPSIYKNVDTYFNGWRDRAEIGHGLKKVIAQA